MSLFEWVLSLSAASIIILVIVGLYKPSSSEKMFSKE